MKRTLKPWVKKTLLTLAITPLALTILALAIWFYISTPWYF